MAHDETVSAKHVLRAVLELQRRGSDAVVQELEALEPSLVEYLLEGSCRVHSQLLRSCLPVRRALRLFRQTESIAIVCVMAVRQAHFDLWQLDHGEPTAPDEPASPDGPSA